MGNDQLEGIALQAGDLDSDGTITLADYCALYPLTLLNTPSNTI
jgi:hypothetical protein